MSKIAIPPDAMTEERKSFERFNERMKLIKKQRVITLLTTGMTSLLLVGFILNGQWLAAIGAGLWIVVLALEYKVSNIQEEIAKHHLEWDKAAHALKDQIIALQKK